MGTNFYLVKNGPTLQRPIHIGKSSCGWLFCFHDQNNPWANDPIVWHTWPQVETRLRQLTKNSDRYVIMNEYSQIVPFDEFVELVQSKQNDPNCKNNPDNFKYCNNIDGYRFDGSEFS